MKPEGTYKKVLSKFQLGVEGVIYPKNTHSLHSLWTIQRNKMSHLPKVKNNLALLHTSLTPQGTLEES